MERPAKYARFTFSSKPPPPPLDAAQETADEGMEAALRAASRAAQFCMFGPTSGTSSASTAAPEPSANAGSWATVPASVPGPTPGSWVRPGQQEPSARTWEEAPELQPVDWSQRTRRPFRRQFLERGGVDAAVADARRAELGIAVSEPGAQGPSPAPLQQFKELDGVLPKWLTDACRDNGWEAPTPIQAQGMPLVLEGKDLIGIAQTGSGKTGAFLIPAVVHMEDQEPLTRAEPGPMVLVLAPTRELAVQISDEAAKLLKQSWNSWRHRGGLRTTVFYGGGKKWQQLQAMTFEGSHVVVATPGRLLDFLREKKVSLARCTYLVLDEADRMLDLGFSGEVERIASQVRPERQTVFFSATWSDQVQSLARGFCSEDPVFVRVKPRGKAGSGAGDAGEEGELRANESIQQEVVVMDSDDGDWRRAQKEKRSLMDAHIRRILAMSEDTKILVFVNQKTLADELSATLCEEGFKADALHGGRSQDLRLWVLDEFRKGSVRVLVATDVLGRGLDIPNVSHVIVYEMGAVDDYVHRIGRTGRGPDGKGHALAFFEFYWKAPEVAGQLVGLLERAKQVVPPKLRTIAQEVASGKRGGGGGGGWHSGGSWSDRAAGGAGGGAAGGSWKDHGGSWRDGGGSRELWKQSGSGENGGAAGAAAQMQSAFQAAFAAAQLKSK